MFGIPVLITGITAVVANLLAHTSPAVHAKARWFILSGSAFVGFLIALLLWLIEHVRIHWV